MGIFNMIKKQKAAFKAHLKEKDDQYVRIKQEELEQLKKERRELEKKAALEAEIKKHKGVIFKSKHPVLNKVGQGIAQNFKNQQKKKKKTSLFDDNRETWQPRF